MLLFESTPSSDASEEPGLVVTDISRAREGEFEEIGKWKGVIGNRRRDNRLHSLTVSNDGRRAYFAYLGGGFLVADTSDFAEARPEPEVRLVTPVEKRVFWTDPGAHSAIKLLGQALRARHRRGLRQARRRPARPRLPVGLGADDRHRATRRAPAVAAEYRLPSTSRRSVRAPAA